MNSRTSTRLLAILLLAAAPLAASIASPDAPPITPDTGWVQDCQKTINNKIRGEHYDAQKVLFRYDDMTLSELSETKNKLAGSGEYVKSDGYRLSFDYQCVYDAATSSVESAGYYQSPAYAEPAPRASVSDAGCSLYDRKGGRYVYHGDCTVAVLDERAGNEFLVTLENGDKYIFEAANAMYRVLTPRGWSDSPAVQTTDGNMRLFYWGDWVMTITGGPQHGNY
ncbi:MAG: hypothetical protein IT344_05550 [Candidatus Dadabacteria bacterium]|nr:hypothetical protein [Candidatus Dadabacteria bacterium]